MSIFVTNLNHFILCAGDPQPALAAGDGDDRTHVPVGSQHLQARAPARYRPHQVRHNPTKSSHS